MSQSAVGIERMLTPKEQHADLICEWIAEGKSLASYCRDNKVRYGSVTEWLNEDEQFAANYTRAREDSADADADKINDIAGKVERGEMDPNAARVAIDAYKWSSGKRKPKKYGDKQEVTHNVTEEMAAVMQRIRSKS